MIKFWWQKRRSCWWKRFSNGKRVWRRRCRVNWCKTKVMKCEARFGPTDNLGKWSCGVCISSDWAFPTVAAKVWNTLLVDVTSGPSLPPFKRRLKTELFKHCYTSVGVQWLLSYGFAFHCAVTWPWSFFALRHDSCLSFLLTYLLLSCLNYILIAF